MMKIRFGPTPTQSLSQIRVGRDPCKRLDEEIRSTVFPFIDFKSSFIWGNSTYELMDDPDLNSPLGVSSDYANSDVTCDDVLPRVMVADDGITPQWGWNIGFGQCGMTYSKSETAGETFISFEIYWNGQTRSADETFFILLNQVCTILLALEYRQSG